MSTQISVVIAYYRDPELCSTALHSLERLSGTANALDAAILRRNDSGKGLDVTEVAEFRPGELSGRSVTEVLPPHILAHSAVGESASRETAHFQDRGLDINLLKEVGENLPPDGAALVIMIEENWLKDLTGMLTGYSDFERFVMRPEPPSHVEE